MSLPFHDVFRTYLALARNPASKDLPPLMTDFLVGEEHVVLSSVFLLLFLYMSYLLNQILILCVTCHPMLPSAYRSQCTALLV